MSTPTALRIKQARHSLRMTQEEFARKLDVSVRSVPDWESGKRRPRIAVLRRISEVADVPLDELVADDAEAAQARMREEAAATLMARVMTALAHAKEDALWNGVERRTRVEHQATPVA